jgi:hypothetical protein
MANYGSYFNYTPANFTPYAPYSSATGGGGSGAYGAAGRPVTISSTTLTQGAVVQPVVAKPQGNTPATPFQQSTQPGQPFFSSGYSSPTQNESYLNAQDVINQGNRYGESTKTGFNFSLPAKSSTQTEVNAQDFINQGITYGESTPNGFKYFLPTAIKISEPTIQPKPVNNIQSFLDTLSKDILLVNPLEPLKLNSNRNEFLQDNSTVFPLGIKGGVSQTDYSNFGLARNALGIALIGAGAKGEPIVKGEPFDYVITSGAGRKVTGLSFNTEFELTNKGVSINPSSQLNFENVRGVQLKLEGSTLEGKLTPGIAEAIRTPDLKPGISGPYVGSTEYELFGESGRSLIKAQSFEKGTATLEAGGKGFTLTNLGDINLGKGLSNQVVSAKALGLGGGIAEFVPSDIVFKFSKLPTATLVNGEISPTDLGQTLLTGRQLTGPRVPFPELELNNVEIEIKAGNSLQSSFDSISGELFSNEKVSPAIKGSTRIIKLFSQGEGSQKVSFIEPASRLLAKNYQTLEFNKPLTTGETKTLLNKILSDTKLYDTETKVDLGVKTGNTAIKT